MNFSAREQSAKARLKVGSRSSKQPKQTLNMEKEEDDHQSSRRALLADVEEDGSRTTRLLLAYGFNVNQSSIVRCFKKLGRRWDLAGWVLQELSDGSKTERVRVFADLMQ